MKQTVSFAKSAIPDTRPASRGLSSLLGNAAFTNCISALPVPDSKAVSSPAVIQRLILFSGGSRKVPPCTTDAELIECLTDYYGEEHKELIARLVREYSTSEDPFTLDEVHHYVARNIEARLPAGSARTTPQAAYNQLAFTTATRATLASEALTETLCVRNTPKRHAERELLEMLKAYEDIRGKSLTLTINNSPCLACARALVKWGSETGNHLTVRFCNCYGSEEEFAKSMEILRGAGVILHTFDLPKLHPDWIASKYSKRMDAMQARKGRIKETVDFDSDSEEGIVPETDPDFSDSSSFDMLEFILDRWREETQSDIYVANGTEYTAINHNVRQDGACFWDSLRRHNIDDDSIEAAAQITGLQVDAHIYMNDVFRFIEALSNVMEQPIRLEVAEFNYGDITLQSFQEEIYGEGVLKTIRLAFFHINGEGDGHFVPPMRY